MSILSWLFHDKSSDPAASANASAAGQTPVQSGAAQPDPMEELKEQRHQHRENLYEVVRSVMLRSEVLTSNYKFKVLSLDVRGRQFMVMIDLLNDQALPPQRWAGVEQLMATTALQHHDLQVKAVYWRLMMAPSEVTSSPAAEAAPATAPAATAAASPAAAAAVIAPALHGFEPINQDEVMAFKRAIEGAAPSPGPARSETPAHGYEDTQLMEPEPEVSPLSKTQFGGLD